MLSVLALASSLVWGTSDFFAGLASRRHPAVAVVGWTQGLALVVDLDRRGACAGTR